VKGCNENEEKRIRGARVRLAGVGLAGALRAGHVDKIGDREVDYGEHLLCDSLIFSCCKDGCLKITHAVG
jgi:hypothetical protein